MRPVKLRKGFFMKKIVIPVFVFLFFLLAGIGVRAYIEFLSEPVSDGHEDLVSVDFEVSDGMTAKTAGKLLEENGLIKNAGFFYLCARFPKAAAFVSGESERIFSVKKGYCRLNSAMSLADIFKEISSGKETFVTVSVPEGLTVSKIARRLENAGLCSADDFIFAAQNSGRRIFSEHGLDIDSDSVEGFLFPDTYNIPVSYSPEKIIGMMMDNLLAHLKSRPETAAAETLSGSELYRTIILASIIEREYRSEDEAPLIAGVFQNRLKIGMPLQSCATVEYIITEILHKPHPGVILYSDLELESPFNTYKYTGLPPSPISNPGYTAVRAALNPHASDYLYFTLTDSENGTHTFSKDLNAHINATNRFRTKRAAGN